MPLEGTAAPAGDQAGTPAVAPPAGGETTPSVSPSTTPPPDPAAAGGEDDAAATPDPGLLAPEEFEKLKSDPKALIKALNKGFTTKMQEMSGVRKLYEAYQKNPAETLRILAEHHGLQVGDPKPKTSAEQTVDEITPILEEALGPELAGKLKPAFAKLAKQVVDTEIQPVKEYMDSGMAQAALSETQAVMTKFSAKYPDWKKHEPAMMEIAKKMQPGKDADPYEYMEHLYRVATYDLSDADRVRGTIDRINDAAAASDKPAGSVPGTKVAQTPKKFASMEEATAAAFAAAKRGERWEPRP